MADMAERKRFVDPKLHFSNERTLLQWVGAATLLMTAAIALLNFSGQTKDQSVTTSRLVGYVLCAVPVLFLVYALVMYVVRSNALQNGVYRTKASNKGPWSDTFGPVVLVVVLCAIMVGTFLISIFSINDVADDIAAVRLAAVEAIPLNEGWEWRVFCPDQSWDTPESLLADQSVLGVLNKAPGAQSPPKRKLKCTPKGAPRCALDR